MALGTPQAFPEGVAGSMALPAWLQRSSPGSSLAGGGYPAKSPDSMANCRRDDRSPRPVHAAFYGRTNAVGVDAAVVLARQFRECRDAAGDGVISSVFYDAAGGVSQTLVQMLRQLEPLAVRDGGWSDLTTQITTANRPVTMIVCDSPDRIARRPAELRARLHLPARHRVTLLFAGAFPHGPVPAGELELLLGLTRSGLAAIPHGSVRRHQWSSAR
jgi:hypothetical protein